MRKLLIAAIATKAMFGIAWAADLDVRPLEPMIPAPLYTWSGLYFGANAGLGWEHTSDTSSLSGGGGTVLFSDTQTSNANGLVGGGQIGINYQNGYWVEGLEGDFQGATQRATHAFTCGAGICAGSPVAASLNQEINWFGTARARVGFAPLDRMLLYATGGVAYGHVDSMSTLAGAGRATEIHAGWTAGAGIEALVAQNWTVRVEYLYIDLGRVSDTLTSTVTSIGGPALNAATSSRVTDNLVRVGVNYKFDWWIIPKY